MEELYKIMYITVGLDIIIVVIGMYIMIRIECKSKK